MPKAAVSEAEIVRLTMENVRSFYNRKPEVTTAPMTEDFVWIGANDFQWSEGLSAFERVTKKEYEEPPVLLYDEEYHLLLHERNVWIVYGRYKIMTTLEDGSIIHAHARGSFVWRMIGGKLKLAHVHVSHAQDIPLNQLAPQPVPLTEQTSYFDYLKQLDAIKSDGEKLVFRDRNKKYHYLFPSDILYIQAAMQRSVIHTKEGSFEVWGLLADYEKRMPDTFLRLHKSYLVNSMYIDSVRRYRATLKQGQELPISKERYMEIKRRLKGVG